MKPLKIEGEEEMSQTRHFCQSVSGALANWTAADWKLMAKANDMSVKDCKEYFKEAMREGKRVLPFGDACEGFSYQAGCPGHDKEKP